MFRKNFSTNAREISASNVRSASRIVIFAVKVERALSSAGSERMLHTHEVGGSIPSAPTVSQTLANLVYQVLQGFFICGKGVRGKWQEVEIWGKVEFDLAQWWLSELLFCRFVYVPVL